VEAWDRLGLEPRNRDGRYGVEAGVPPNDGGSRSARLGRGRSPEHGMTKRTADETEVQWPTRQVGLPGVRKGTQGSFGELE
jgi:hypothetical protein